MADQEDRDDLDGTGGQDDQDPGDSDLLEGASLEDAQKTIVSLRKENAKWRVKLREQKEEQEKLAEAVARLEADQTELDELRNKMKTAEEKEAERLQALEAQAAKADSLAPYLNFVKSRYEDAIEGISGMDDDDPRKAKYQELLSSFDDDNYLGRLRVLEALSAAEGVRNDEEVREGDNGSPAKKGGGITETPYAKKLAWSPAGLREAQLGGLVPHSKD